MNIPRAFLAATVALLLLSCGASGKSAIKLDPTPPLSGGPGWAVITSAYARLKDGPSRAAKDIHHLRRGEVVEVVGRDLAAAAEDRGIWYRLKSEDGQGWAWAEDLDVFPTKAQAELSAARYR